MDLRPSALPDDLPAGLALPLVVAGMAAISYATYLVMIRASPYGRYDRASIMAPLGLALLVGGLLLLTQ